MAEYYRALQISDDHEQAFRSDFELLKGEPTKPSTRSWKTTALAACAVTASILLLAVAISSKQVPAESLSARCVHALGGGKVGLGGDFPFVHQPECQRQLQAYSAPGGEYWQEVFVAASSAINTFKRTLDLQKGDPSKVIVFDIDETALSNIAVMFDTEDAYNSYVLRANAPALEPVLEFYNYLYSANYSIAFITGRDESQRAATATNLASAGYGTQCATGATGEVVRSEKPCYVHLYLRELSDTRLASVYKPSKRDDLKQRGFTLVGSIGDQFSDLSGGHSAATAFKLPNPFYYIL